MLQTLAEKAIVAEYRLKKDLVSKKSTRPLTDLIFVGLATLQDLPRVDVSQTIRECHTAGVKVVMDT